MKEIRLAREQGAAVVDDEDHPALAQYRWSAARRGRRTYAVANVNGRDVLMHRLILSAPAGLEVDHKNGDGLDNRRSNLRLATRRQNCFNRGSTPGSSSRYAGVAFCKRTRRWEAYVTDFRGKRKFLGRFSKEWIAARTRDLAARHFYGEFARLNFPEKEFSPADLEAIIAAWTPVLAWLRAAPVKE